MYNRKNTFRIELKKRKNDIKNEEKGVFPLNSGKNKNNNENPFKDILYPKKNENIIQNNYNDNIFCLNNNNNFIPPQNPFNPGFKKESLFSNAYNNLYNNHNLNIDNKMEEKKIFPGTIKEKSYISITLSSLLKDSKENSKKVQALNMQDLPFNCPFCHKNFLSDGEIHMYSYHMDKLETLDIMNFCTNQKKIIKEKADLLEKGIKEVNNRMKEDQQIYLEWLNDMENFFHLPIKNI